jgi:hypothetical protein
LPRGWIGSLTNVLLIRDPSEVVASYVRSRPAVTDADIGIVEQNELYDLLGGQVPVMDSSDFLCNPELYLRWLCDHAGVDFTPAMLRWPAGSRPTDGVWGRYWYGAVTASTGFEPYRARQVSLHGEALEVVKRVLPFYERLRSVRLVL